MLNVPNQGRGPTIKTFSNKVPTPDEIVILPQPLLKAAAKIAERLKNNISADWAIGGDAGELILGVNVKADYLEVLTTKQGCDQICDELEEYVKVTPSVVEKKLAREADIDGKMLPVYVKSYYAELSVDGVKVEIYGDEQIKVGDWEWGDPLYFKADYSYISGGVLPLVPLSLKSELDLGLGWLDRVSLISDAVLQKHHGH
jgi:hypothetical protein